jgi:hypothetical protein
MAESGSPPPRWQTPAIWYTPACARPKGRNAPQVAKAHEYAIARKVEVRTIELGGAAV